MDNLIPIVGIFFVIGVPVMSLAAHFVLRPMVRDVIAAIRGKETGPDDRIEERLARLEEALEGQADQLDRLLEAEAFRLRLESGTKPPHASARP